MTILFQDPENGEMCQVGGWGRVHKKQFYTTVDNGKKIGRQWDAQTDMMEVCVPIVDINDCRNNYIVKKANTTKLSNFKQEIKGQIDWIYDGINICAGSDSKDSCNVRFIVCFQFSDTQLKQMRNICFLSPLVPSKLDNLVLLSLYIF